LLTSEGSVGKQRRFPVIASAGEAIQGQGSNMDCFVAIAPLRKRFAFVAGNDG
jgi:hypothetical protein